MSQFEQAPPSEAEETPPVQYGSPYGTYSPPSSNEIVPTIAGLEPEETKILTKEVEEVSLLLAPTDFWADFEGSPACAAAIALGFMVFACGLYFIARRRA